MLTVQTAPPLPPIPPLAVLEDLVLPIFGMALAAFVAWLLYRTINRWLDRRAGGALEDIQALRAEVARVQAQAGGVEELRLRVGELEERLDFTERVLARHQERRSIAPGPDEA